MKNSLCIDGGGIRGLIPALLLAEVERRTAKPCYKLFNLIAGTSTGGILALALAIGIPAEEIVQMYRQEGGKIFSRPWWRRRVWNLFKERYSAAGIEAVLKEKFAMRMMRECKTEVLITTYDLTDDRLQTFGRQGAYFLREIARATSAAPTYFPPAEILSSTHSYVDGGIAANNPSELARDYCSELWPGEPVATLSLGTGSVQVKASAGGGGLFRNASDMFRIAMSSQSALADTAMRRRTNTPHTDKSSDSYVRLQAYLDPANAHMDDTSPENIQALEVAALALIDRMRPEFDEVVAELAA